MAGTGRQQRHPSARAGRSDAPETNPAVGAAIREVVDNQLRDGTPPETRQTLDRLLAADYPEDEVRRLIACAVTSEIFDRRTEEPSSLRRGTLYRGAPSAADTAVGGLNRFPPRGVLRPCQR